MAQHYTDASRENDPHALPDIETFLVDRKGYVGGLPFVMPHEPGEPAMGIAEPGWYFWFCFPGCLPTSEPEGPYKTEDDAVEEARLLAGFCAHGQDSDSHDPCMDGENERADEMADARKEGG